MGKSGVYEDIVFPEENFGLVVDSDKISFLSADRHLTKVLHEAIEIKYFVEGSSVLQIGDEIVSAQTGDIIVINSYEFHSTIDFGEQKGKYHYFLVDLDFFADTNIGALDLRKEMFEKQHRFPHLLRERKDLQSLLLQIVKEMTGRALGYHSAVGGLLLTFFTLLLRSDMRKMENEGVGGARMRYYRMIEPALRMIRNEYTRKLTLEELASLCSISKCHFSRVFKDVTNMTVVQYITEFRFNIADFMLANSEQSIADIARSCGFDNESYFCRYYKKKRGISPYRNRTQLR